MNKGSIQNFFEDFKLGQVFECPTPRLLTEGDRVAYIAFTGDRTPRFCDSHGLVHPLIVFHTVLGQTVRQISLNAQANLGYAEMVWKTPVRVGDQIQTAARIIGLKENSNRKTGIAYVKTVATNQRNETVLEYIRWVMVKKNREDVTAYLSAPALSSTADTVVPDMFLSYPPDPFDARATGGTFFLEDYAIGERICHVDGMTVNSTDHVSFTRLYQNTARVHFDAILTQGKPLVYGGFPMSIGYAQAFNGLENRLGIVAVNGGTHSNPVYAGDTLYSFTEVLDRKNLSDQHGALRLRLVVVKNHQPDDTFQVKAIDSSSGKEKYDSSVVLDLDYWELMRRQPTG